MSESLGRRGERVLYQWQAPPAKPLECTLQADDSGQSPVVALFNADGDRRTASRHLVSRPKPAVLGEVGERVRWQSPNHYRPSKAVLMERWTREMTLVSIMVKDGTLYRVPTTEIEKVRVLDGTTTSRPALEVGDLVHLVGYPKVPMVVERNLDTVNDEVVVHWLLADKSHTSYPFPRKSLVRDWPNPDGDNPLYRPSYGVRTS
jgi:hypothetical protein